MLDKDSKLVEVREQIDLTSKLYGIQTEKM